MTWEQRMEECTRWRRQERDMKLTGFCVGDTVSIRAEFRRQGDFGTATVSNIDPEDGTVDVEVNGADWGQWFMPLEDGAYEIEIWAGPGKVIKGLTWATKDNLPKAGT